MHTIARILFPYSAWIGLIIFGFSFFSGEVEAQAAKPAGINRSPEQALISKTTIEASESAVKWHPGNYVTLAPFANDGPEYFAAVLNEIAEFPALRGVQKRYMWSDLEKHEDTYDFTEIENDLAQVSKYGKRLVILLHTKSFNSGKPAAPLYMRYDRFEQGQFLIAIAEKATTTQKKDNGSNIKLWNTLVRDRLISLVRALGERFNNHPYLEAVAFTETATGKSVETISRDQETLYFDNLLLVNQEMKKAFPNTVTIQFVNFPRWMLKDLIDGMKKSGVGLGGPDVFPEDLGLRAGAYTHYPKLSNIVPLAPSVQHENYYTRRHKGPRDNPSVEELYHFAKEDLKANYIFWTRRLVPPEKPYLKVLNLMRNPSIASDPAGGLNSACPGSFKSCNSQ